ncbi:MAG: amino acid adenylation domain-containing protein, partial [Acidobacteriia bacterium]|nr:amino acid adenylation domain-containing protein [Terriglobia bacterium]
VRTPGAVAVVCGGNQLTYKELNLRANRLAHYLRQLGVKPDDRVAICAEQSVEVIEAVLGTLKAGGAYVPLDPSYPTERLKYMLENSNPRVVLTQSYLVQQVEDLAAGVPIINIDDDAAWFKYPEDNPKRTATGLQPENIVYVIYTSGSLGRPKGVVIEQHRLCNLIFQRALDLCINSGKRVSHFVSFSFDAWDEVVMASLTGGASLYLVESIGSVEALTRVIKQNAVTHVLVPPTVLATLAEQNDWESVSVLIVGGSRLSAETAVRWGRGRRLISEYGPTEATISATLFECRDDEERQPSIGSPIGNVRVYILNSSLLPVPVGVVGEIFIGGLGVARGYWGEPGMTAERFLPDPYSAELGARIYRTGDLGRWLASGNIEFMGRNDDQIKIRGYRIEPEEIEANLAEHHGVRKAVVIARADQTGEKRLVAYYTCNETNDPAPSVQELRAHLAARLPAYMVPAAYVRLETIPLTVNGKLDRRALPEPDDAYVHQAYEAPVGEVEEIVAEIWSDILGVKRVGRWDNFFDLGGHSLLAVRVATWIRHRLGLEVAISELFAHPDLADFAAKVQTSLRGKLPPIARAEREGRLPLSFAQQRLWFLAQMEGVGEAYHMPLWLHLKGKLDRVALRRALNQLVKRHEVLRTRFVVVNGEPEQRVVQVEESSFELLERDLENRVDIIPELERLAAEQKNAAFNLETGPLIRAQLVRMKTDEHALLIVVHHIVCDGWSVGVLHKDLGALYDAFLHGETDPLPELVVQYVDYALWQRRWMEGELLQHQADYWRKNLSGVPELMEVPGDYVRPASWKHTGALSSVMLEHSLTIGLKELSVRHGTTLYMVLLAGWAILLARLSGQHDVVIGTPVANRRQIEIESLIGFFVNTLLLRLDLSGHPSVGEVLARVKAQSIAAQQHQDIPFEQVVEIVQPVRSLAHSPLLQATLVWDNFARHPLQLSGLQVEALELASNRVANSDLTLVLKEEHDHIEGGLLYATALFAAVTIERYVTYYGRLLQAMVQNDLQEVGSLPVLSDRERQQLLYDWNDTHVKMPQQCIHQLFEMQARRTPDAQAVICEEDSLTYRQLNRRANQLAHYLQELGVKPEARVAVCADRSLEMVIAMLAVFKAGGVYVPMDPVYPAERLQFMLQDSSPVVLLAKYPWTRLFDGTNGAIQVLDLAEAARRCENHLETDFSLDFIGLMPTHLAYLIYTSGSTGLPKAVMVDHRGVMNTLLFAKDLLNVSGKDVIASMASNAFDISVLEIMTSWSGGGATLIVKPTEVLNPERLLSLLKKVTLLHAVPVLMSELTQALQNHAKDDVSGIRTLLTGGDRVPGSLLEEMRQFFPGQEIRVLYGPTETSIICANTEPVSGNTANSNFLVGHPIANMRIYVLDEYRAPVPVGVTGELYIAGAGVARGYLHRADLTAERFVPDPYANAAQAGERMYRSGDLGKWRDDGHIEFVGRSDLQVKIRGYRIELGEIEAILASYPGVRQAAVVAKEDRSGKKRLVAYYLPEHSRNNEEISFVQVRAYLSGKLPEYMVPTAYVRLETIPLTVNGKLDRRALPEPDDAHVQQAYEAPVGEVEEIVAEIWSDILGVKRVGRWDNFFDLGGHSLLGVLMATWIRHRLGLEVAISELFAHPALADFAAKVQTSLRGKLPPIARTERDGRLPLSFAQQRLWFLAQMEGAGEAYHIPLRLHLKGKLDRVALRRALNQLVKRHEVLRTRFVVVNGEPVQEIEEAEKSRFAMREQDVSGRPDVGMELGALREEEVNERFDLAGGPLIR